jgi:hypothetical protein
MIPTIKKGLKLRSGQMALGIVLFILTLAFLGLWTRQGVALQSQVDAARFLAGQSAMLSGRRATAGMVKGLLPALVDPKNPAFLTVRKRLIQSTASTVDLTDLGAVPKDLESIFWRPVAGSKRPSLGQKENPKSDEPLRQLGTVTLHEARMKVEDLHLIGLDPRQPTRDPADLVPDERVGLLKTEVSVSTKVGGHVVRRKLTECRELKLVLSGPPRPFDQMGLYLGDLATITDPKEANALRDRVFEVLDDMDRELTRLTAAERNFGASLSRLARIQNGLPGRGNRAEAVPRLPEEPAVLYGLSDAEEPFSLASLDLAADLKRDLASITSARSAFSQEVRRQKDATEAATRLARFLNQAVMRIWQYHQTFRILPRGQEEFANRLAPYEAHATSTWYDRRVLMDLTEDSPTFQDWLSGKRELTGVFRLKSAKPLRLTGSLRGRAVLVIDAPDLSLSDVAQLPGNSLVTLVVNRGTLRLSGAVHAALLVGADARLSLSKDANLTGSLIVPRPRARTEWVGTLMPSSAVPGAESVNAALALPGRGAYALAISPNPLWVEGDRQ